MFLLRCSCNLWTDLVMLPFLQHTQRGSEDVTLGNLERHCQRIPWRGARLGAAQLWPGGLVLSPPHKPSSTLPHYVKTASFLGWDKPSHALPFAKRQTMLKLSSTRSSFRGQRFWGPGSHRQEFHLTGFEPRARLKGSPRPSLEPHARLECQAWFTQLKNEPRHQFAKNLT